MHPCLSSAVKITDCSIDLNCYMAGLPAPPAATPPPPPTCTSWDTRGVHAVQESTSVPLTRCSSFFATAPAATRPMVSRAEERPPPAIARMPYLAS